MLNSAQLARLIVSGLLLLLLFFVGVFTGCQRSERVSEATANVGGQTTPQSVSQQQGSGGLRVEGAKARPAPLAGGTGAVYFQLHNDGDSAVKWIGAESPAAGAVEIHTTANDNGVMRMRQISEGVELGAGEAIELAPGGMHLMLVNLAAPLAEGDTIQVTLHFEDAGDLTFEVPVVGMDDLPAEGEMEHEH